VTALVLAVAAVAAFLLSTVGTDRTITVGTGPRGTLAYESAARLVQGMAERGFPVDILETDQTADLVNLLADPASPVDVTFMAEQVNAADYPGVNSLGTVYRLPYVFAAWPGSHDITSVADIQGRRIDLGSKGSVRAVFVESVLAEFGVTPDNTTFLYLPTTATREDVEALDVEVQTTDGQDARPYIVQGLASGELKMIPVPEAAALDSRVQSAEEVDVPYGGFSLSPPVPEVPTPTVAQLITIVANSRLSPAAVYAIAQELSAEFSPGTAWTDSGEFPNFSDRQLPSNRYAVEYYATGEVPWQFENLPPVLADSFFALVLFGTVLLLVASIYSLLLPEFYGLWTGVLRPRSEEKFIASMERAVAEGRDIPERDVRRLRGILQHRDATEALRRRAEQLRPQADMDS
jgi:TRAP-type uncharacterized transport system substrate-binding protein